MCFDWNFRDKIVQHPEQWEWKVYFSFEDLTVYLERIYEAYNSKIWTLWNDVYIPEGRDKSNYLIVLY